MDIDREWFDRQLELRRKSQQHAARTLGIDQSAFSRILSGGRKLKMGEAEKLARLLIVPVDEVYRRMGMSTSAAIQRTRIEATIGEQGRLAPMAEPADLPLVTAGRAQATLGTDHRGRVRAAQVRAETGPLSAWDDAVLLWADSDVVEPTAMGVLSIARLRDGVELIGHLEKIRKTGEATVRLATGEVKEVEITSAMPVLAVLP